MGSCTDRREGGRGEEIGTYYMYVCTYAHSHAQTNRREKTHLDIHTYCTYLGMYVHMNMYV